MRTDEQIVADADALAREMAQSVMGYQLTPDMPPMREMRDPRLRMCWNMACCAIEELQQTDAREALRNLED